MTRFQGLRSLLGELQLWSTPATYLHKCQETYHIRPQKPVMQLTTEAWRMGPGADIAIIDRLTVLRQNAIHAAMPRECGLCGKTIGGSSIAAEGGAAWQQGREVWERWRATCWQIWVRASVSRQRLLRRKLLLGAGVAMFGRARKARTCMACRWPFWKEFVKFAQGFVAVSWLQN